VDEVRFARAPKLALVDLRRKDVGLLDLVDADSLAARPELIDDVLESNHK